MKEVEEAEKGEVLDTRNQRRAPSRKARGLKSYEEGVDRAQILRSLSSLVSCNAKSM